MGSVSHMAPEPNSEVATVQFDAWSGAKILETEFPPLIYLIDGILAQGVTMLAGKPKRGKSWLALDFGLSVASGQSWNDRDVAKGDVLYLALEDNLRRLQSRLKKLKCDEAMAKNIRFVTESFLLGGDFTKAVEHWVEDVKDAKLCIIDTYTKVKPQSANSEEYGKEYSVISQLLQIANKHNIAVLVIHHEKKGYQDDPFDGVLGSTALTGGPDTIMLLTTHIDGRSVLLGKGRDIEEYEWEAQFSKETCKWKIVGELSVQQSTETKTKIIEAISAGKNSPKCIAEHSRLSPENVRQALPRLVKEGQVIKVERGVYNLPD